MFAPNCNPHINTRYAREGGTRGIFDSAPSFPLSRSFVLSQLYHEPASLISLPSSPFDAKDPTAGIRVFSSLLRPPSCSDLQTRTASRSTSSCHPPKWTIASPLTQYKLNSTVLCPRGKSSFTTRLCLGRHRPRQYRKSVLRPRSTTGSSLPTNFASGLAQHDTTEPVSTPSTTTADLGHVSPETTKG
jgi:hypothetical protein